MIGKKFLIGFGIFSLVALAAIFFISFGENETSPPVKKFFLEWG